MAFIVFFIVLNVSEFVTVKFVYDFLLNLTSSMRTALSEKEDKNASDSETTCSISIITT